MFFLAWKKLWHHRVPCIIAILGLSASNGLLIDGIASNLSAFWLEGRLWLLLGVGTLLWTLFFQALGKGFFRDFVALHQLGMTPSRLKQLKSVFISAVLLPSLALSFVIVSFFHGQIVGTLYVGMAGLFVLYGLLGLLLFRYFTPHQS